MCNFCGNIRCNGECRSNFPFNRPFFNPPFTQPFLTPFNRCAPQVPPVPPFPCPTCTPCNTNGCLQTISADCIFPSIAYSCIGSTVSQNLTTILGLIDAALCTLAPPQCPTWINLPLSTIASGASIGLPFPSATNSTTVLVSTPQYSIDGCGNVRLRGFVQEFGLTFVNPTDAFTSMHDTNVNTNAGPFAVLPAGYRPKSPLVIPCYIADASLSLVYSSYYNNVIKGWIFVDVDGSCYFGASGYLAGSGFVWLPGEQYSFIFSLDSVQFSIK